MTESVQDQPGQAIQCDNVRDLIERYSSMTGPYSLTVCAEATNTAVLKLVATIDGTTVTVVAEASWLAALWRMSPGDRRSIRVAALTTALEAWSRTDKAVPVAVGEVRP